MTVLIANVKERSLGYWASVLHHFCINAFSLSLAYWLSAN